MEPAKILVVDDESAILRLLREALTQWGYQVTSASSAAEALQALRGDMFDAVITDIRMPDMNGLELLKEIKRHDESVEVVVMTGYPTIASAVEALKVGAFDYLSKPLLLDELRHLMARMTERRFLRGEVHSLRARLGEELTVNELVGNSPPMQRVKEIIGRVAPTDSPVLIEGESGTGKELVAAAIHRDLDRSIAEGRLRQDLYYRLNVVRVSLPPLRARREDIPALVNHFIRRFSRRFRREIRGIAPEALVALQAYDFPGNVRELENLIERAFAMGAREQITLADLPSLAAGHAAPVTVTSGAIPQLADVEKELILRALAFYKDDKEAAATALGISRRTIYRRLKEYGML